MRPSVHTEPIQTGPHFHRSFGDGMRELQKGNIPSVTLWTHLIRIHHIRLLCTCMMNQPNLLRCLLLHTSRTDQAGENGADGSVGLTVREKRDEATHGAPPWRAGWSRQYRRSAPGMDPEAMMMRSWWRFILAGN